MNYIFNYTDKPGRAVMYYRDQFVLLATRTGDLVSPRQDMMDEILDDLMTLERAIHQNSHGGIQCRLMLRGVWFDDAHGNIVLHIEQLYQQSPSPALTIEAIQQALHDGYNWYEGQSINVQVYNTAVFFGSDHFGAHLGEFYDKIKKAMLWG